jgi:hypothetical protein
MDMPPKRRRTFFYQYPRALRSRQGRKSIHITEFAHLPVGPILRSQLLSVFTPAAVPCGRLNTVLASRVEAQDPPPRGPSPVTFLPPQIATSVVRLRRYGWLGPRFGLTLPF